ncbi:hypothetical protein [Streptomyces ipomoeae]|uniref:hypothetical protein n=1 Tax=Streptomyces ipomoeae TaxID=103232 RepID=UPI0029B29754|nr:hypothetical protein [Streptomyces ipomoeae]MDX2692215.1 hypothetical protein [Streptomyces ipomoeae]MDX2843575.1 hypothetical protein [Streptomyces ipomoeae]
MTITVAVPGTLHAALTVCTPGGPPAWLAAAAPRCATAHRGVLQLDGGRADQLADLAAAAWWECQQADGDGEPFTTVFAQACAAVLDSLAADRHTQDQTLEGTDR